MVVCAKIKHPRPVEAPRFPDYYLLSNCSAESYRMVIRPGPLRSEPEAVSCLISNDRTGMRHVVFHKGQSPVIACSVDTTPGSGLVRLNWYDFFTGLNIRTAMV
jgi:hypothetical protein